MAMPSAQRRTGGHLRPGRIHNRDGRRLRAGSIATRPQCRETRWRVTWAGSRRARQESGATKGLDGFIKAVRQAAPRDARFRECKTLCRTSSIISPPEVPPRRRTGRQPGVRSVDDTLLMHGDGDSPDGLPARSKCAGKAAGGTPATGADEATWFAAFLRVRRAALEYAHDPATRKAWAEAVGRVNVFRTIAEKGNWGLHGPIVVTGEYEAKIP